MEIQAQAALMMQANSLDAVRSTLSTCRMSCTAASAVKRSAYAIGKALP